MNPERVEDAKKIVLGVKRSTATVKKIDIVLCPSFVYLSNLSNFVRPPVFLGAQDAFFETAGPFTGEGSFSQLYQFSVRFVILGHSERRREGQTDSIVNKKIKAVVGGGMTAILCVGEKTRDTHGEYLHFVKQQIIDGLADVSKKFLGNLVIAYEPVWAVGAKEAMKPEDVHEMSIFIRKILRDMYGTLSDSVRILYGGDVTVNNIGPIMRDGFVQGVLVGRESLKVKDFVEIIKIVEEI